MSTSSSSSSGIGFTGLLTILFIGLKLTGHLDWSWGWVLSPTLFSIGLGLFFLISVGCVMLVAVLLGQR